MVASSGASRFSSTMGHHRLPRASTDGAFLFLVRAGKSRRNAVVCPLLTYLSCRYQARDNDTRIAKGVSSELAHGFAYSIPAALVDDLDGENPPDQS